MQRKQTKKLALSMRGGGARAGAYLGVLEALEEEKIEIHSIIGASGGAYIGGLYALGRSIEEIEGHMARQTFSNYFGWDAIKDFSLFSDDKSVPFLDIITRGKKIQDTKIKLYIQVTNLDKQKIEVFEKGDLAQAIYASMAMPILVKPYEIDGIHYADGDLISGFDTKFLKQKGADVVLGLTPMDMNFKNNREEHKSISSRVMDMYEMMIRTIRQMDQKIDPVDLLLDNLADNSIGVLDLPSGIAQRARGKKITKKNMDKIWQLIS